MTTITPFQNESDAIEIGGLTIENRLDRVELYGALQITKDKAGLEHAQELKQLIDAALASLRALDAQNALPQQIALAPVETVRNPFAD
ncbi:hypothetical protein D3870_11930 [Noviherbaspirillum cavernae]|uniref:Uncharacterized protein n=1 Tax=Noviherbaspirillum cavernae TaxID=2320862 RepID=A0A418X2G6_9BURK|nr:hypothetical protein [Noviherbaspirillum cavernae]RJG06626.1 hypothetical protein D3870_11930 [Noviherbaspirillum cavernae]